MSEEDDACDLAEAIENKQRLKAAVHYGVGEICSQIDDTTFSREMVAVLTETTFRQCELLAADLEVFAKHAKRSTVSAEDVKLCSRRNPSLLKILTERAEKLREHRVEQQRAGKEQKGGTKGVAEDASTKEQEEIPENDIVKTKKQKRTGKSRNIIIDSD